MKRFDFFNNRIEKSTISRGDLPAYKKNLTQREAIYLLRRTTFATDWQTIKMFTGKTVDEAVESLLDNALKESPSTDSLTWVGQGYKNWDKLKSEEKQPALTAIYEKSANQNVELQNWWIKNMSDDILSIREKMTLFWHGHFTTRFTILPPMPAQLTYLQNQLFRGLHQGNFRTLLEKITIDGAMLIFLNGQENSKKAPNENFSRELLELFTIGISNYTEQDVKEGARALTGWRTNYFVDEITGKNVLESYFSADEHDTGSKTYLGEIIPATDNNTEANVFKYEIQKMIDIILSKKAIEVSTLICTKLYRFFVYSNPKQTNKEVIAILAQTFIENNFEIRPVLAQLLKSTFFFEECNMGIQLKTPAELVIGFGKHFQVNEGWKNAIMAKMGQDLINPPTVAGWGGYREWYDTRTFPIALQQLGYFIDNQIEEHILIWIKQFDDYQNPRCLVKQICTLFLAKLPTKEYLDKYLKVLLGGIPEYEWATLLKVDFVAGNRLKIFMKYIIKSPDFILQ